MNKYLLLGLALIISGAILIGAGGNLHRGFERQSGGIFSYRNFWRN
jgi:hypothetical protein